MQLDPAIKQRVPKKFNRIASTYDLLTGMNPGYRRHLTMSAARVGAPPKGRLLDLCCGTGGATAHLRLRAGPLTRIVGLDLSILARSAYRVSTGSSQSRARL